MKNKHPNFSVVDVLLTALVPIIWGTTYWVTSECLPDARPLTAAAIRTLPAGLALIVISRAWLPPISWMRLLCLSVLNIGAFQFLLFVSAYRLPGGVAALTGSFQPLMLFALVWLVDRQGPTWRDLITACCAVLGMTLVLVGPQTKWDLLGLSAAFGGTTSMALGIFFARRWGAGTQLLGFTGWQLLIGGLVLLPFSLLFEEPLSRLSAINLGGYLYLSIIGTLLAYALWFRGVARLPSVAVSSLGLLSPLTAMLIGWCFLGERLEPVALLGAGIVILSICNLQRQPRASVAHSIVQNKQQTALA